jgi:hypothetical protein
VPFYGNSIKKMFGENEKQIFATKILPGHMTDMTTYTFTRTEADGEYFTDIEASLRFGLKYDVYNEVQQVATLLTNNRKGYALTIEREKLFFTGKCKWSGECFFYGKDDFQNQLVTISVKSSGWFFSRNVYSIIFEKSLESFDFRLLDRKQRKEYKAYFGYEFLLNGQVQCRILNLKKPPIFYQPTITMLEGTIECSEAIDLIMVLCFLQFIDIHIQFEYDAN